MTFEEMKHHMATLVNGEECAITYEEHFGGKSTPFKHVYLHHNGLCVAGDTFHSAFTQLGAILHPVPIEPEDGPVE